MRRVVVTGIGIVSSIGNNAEEVRTSLHNCTPGITMAIGYEDFWFKSQVYGCPNIELEQNIDRRKCPTEQFWNLFHESKNFV